MTYMTRLKKIIALLLIGIMVFSFSACKEKDDDTVLTTKRKTKATTEKDGGDIDIWAYLNGENSDDLSTDEPATVSTGGGSSISSGNYSYEDTPVSFNGSSIFSSATTSKSGYPTFHWNAVSGAIKYNIYRSTSKNGTYSYIDSTTATSYTDKTAISGKQYYYQVKAVKKVAVTTTKKSTTTKKPTSSISTTSVALTKRDTSNAPSTAPVNYTKVADIVALYNAAANQVKSKAIAVTRNYITLQYNEGENSQTFKTLIALAGVKEGTDSNPKQYVGTDQIVKEFPVEGSLTSSTLSASMVRGAACKYSQGYYTIRIVLKDDPAGTVEYSKTCMDSLDISKYSQYVGDITTQTYSATIDAKIYYDGHLDYVVYTVPTKMKGTYQSEDANVNMAADFTIEEFWSINY